MVWNSGGSAITYSFISGREDLFTISSNNLKVANSSDWAGIGTDYYVTVQAINAASQSSSFTIKVSVVSSAKGTIIRFD